MKQSAVNEELIRLFGTLRIEDDNVRSLFDDILRRRIQHQKKNAADQVVELNRELTTTLSHLDQLLNFHLLGEIEADEYAHKKRELRARQSKIVLQIEAQTRQRSENTDIAVQAFELSQDVTHRWVKSDDGTKRRLLEILCLNLTLDGASLVPEWRKPFDVLAEGPVFEKSRDDRN